MAEEALVKKFSAHGDLVFTPFATAPFPHPSRAAGRTYRDVVYPAEKHYSDNTVALFIPADYRGRGRVDFVIHFHGWRNTVAGTLAQFKLIEQFIASNKDAILIVPEGPRDAPDSGGGKLEDPDGFKNFIAEAVALLQQRGALASNATVGEVILSGHSGGYQVISSIVTHGGLTDRVREVWLFDGLYAQTDKFLAWAEQTGGRFLNIYTDAGGTKKQTEAMIATLKQKGKSPWSTTDRAVLPRELKAHRYIFLHTDLGHNEVLAQRRTFQQFLETSGLKTREKN